MAAKHSKRVALYLRASSDDQTESLGAQRMLLVRYAADNNLEIVGEYEDFAKSGDSCNGRDGLQRLMAAAKAGKFDGVLVRQLSRLSRRDSMKTAAQIIGPLLDAGVSIFTASHGNLELNSATGRIMLAVLCEFDHAENVSRSLNVLNGQLKAALSGSWIGMAPYGYRVEGEKHNKVLLLDDESKIATVLRVFELYGAGESCEAIARILNADGIPSAKGGKWQRDIVRDMLERPAYVGDHRFNYQSRGKYYELRDGKPVERKDHWLDDDQEKPRITTNGAEDWVYIRDRWPTIVSRELWNRVQRRLERNGQNKPGPTNKTFVLTGVLRCQCGCTRDMYGKFRSGKKRYQCDGCGGWVKEDEVLDAIGLGIQRHLSPKTIARVRRAIERKTSQPKKRQPNIKSLERKLAKCEQRLLECSSDTVAIVEREIRRLRRELEQARRQLRQQETAAPKDLVDRALAQLFRLPEVLQQTDEKKLKSRLADMVDSVHVRTQSKGKGAGKRWPVARFTSHAMVRVELNQHFPGCRAGVFAVGPRDHVVSNQGGKLIVISIPIRRL